jgi:Fic family protein
VHEGLDAWERLLDIRDSLPDLIHYGLSYQRFEVVHPLLEGNGHIDPLHITVLTIDRRPIAQPFLYLSAHIGR